MKKMMKIALAASVTAGALAGCGSETQAVEQPASVTGYAHGIDSKLWENQWVLHVDDTYPPEGNYRNLYIDPEGRFRGCRAVGDGFFSFDTNDDECGGWWSDGDYCGGDESDHCVAMYDPTYTYEADEATIIMDCVANLQKREYPTPDPITNEACARSRGDGQWVTETTRYILWLTTTNPDYDAEKPDSNVPRTITKAEEVDVSEWRQAKEDIKPTVSVLNGKIIGVSFEE